MYQTRLRETLPLVRERIAAAARRSGRDPAEVTVVTVTKGHGPEAVTAAVRAGLVDLGENRLEELEEKAVGTPPGTVRWHMIGHLQRRKAPRVRGLADLVHSVDSVRLAERLERGADSGAPTLRVLLQVNASGEATKTGFEPGDLVEALGRVLELSSLRVEGLMTMAPYTQDERVLRATFGGLRELRDEAVRQLPAFRGVELSMGMSNDFETAVEEGSTIVRLGTVLLGERPE
jgi:hypothetical protein